MKYLNKSTNISGAYGPAQSSYFENSIPITEEQDNFLVSRNGFVTISENPDPNISQSVVTLTENTKAWETWKSSLPDPLNELRSLKESEISSACKVIIENGVDVDTTNGTEHFDLTEEDQINLSAALKKIDAGATVHPYHSKKTLCRMFTAEEIRNISSAAVNHILYNQTLGNHLLMWVRRAETEDEINSITYSPDNLPQDLKENMESILSESSILLNV